MVILGRLRLKCGVSFATQIQQKALKNKGFAVHG